MATVRRLLAVLALSGLQRLTMSLYLLWLYTFASDKKDVLYLPDVSRTIAECIAVNRRTI